MSIAEQYPARTDANGRTWWRPVRPAGTDLSQWGWTSDPAQAHPDYDALNTTTLVDLVVAREAPVVAAAVERAEAFGEAWARVFELAGGGLAIVPSDPLPVEPLGELGDEWVQLGHVDETQGGLW
ncbi:hypothetical protein SEA_GUANICA15_86 [Mycobacterium phage Guanica15]|nr:hypothetical protein SEA_GUANICA15_86 [Mycobacterium phage Guanica15]